MAITLLFLHYFGVADLLFRFLNGLSFLLQAGFEIEDVVCHGGVAFMILGSEVGEKTLLLRHFRLSCCQFCEFGFVSGALKL